MNFGTLIISVSVLTASAFPLYPSANQRDVALADPRENEAQDKTELSKDVHAVYKSYVDRGDLYTAEEEAGRRGNPMEEEMRHKITAESERLRDRLRQGLAELTERLSPDLGAPGGPLGDLRLRLAPLIQQLRGSLSHNVQEVCGQLSLYLRGLEWAESGAESGAESTSAYREALHGIGRTLEQGGARLADITGDFQSKAWEAMDQKRERGGGGGAGPEEEEEAERPGRMWGEMRSTLAQEVSSIRLEAQSRLGALEAELAAALESVQPLNTAAAAVVNGFCQSAALQNQVSLARMERLLLGSEEEQEAPAAPAGPSQSGSLLQEDFSAKFSALIQDILHSVR